MIVRVAVIRAKRHVPAIGDHRGLFPNDVAGVVLQENRESIHASDIRRTVQHRQVVFWHLPLDVRGEFARRKNSENKGLVRAVGAYAGSREHAASVHRKLIVESAALHLDETARVVGYVIPRSGRRVLVDRLAKQSIRVRFVEGDAEPVARLERANRAASAGLRERRRKHSPHAVRPAHADREANVCDAVERRASA